MYVNVCIHTLTYPHVYWVSDAIQPSLPLFSSPSVFNMSKHQSLFQQVSSPYQVAKVLELQLQHQSFQWIFRTDFLWRDSQESSSNDSSKESVLRHSAFFTVQLSHPYMTTGKTIALTRHWYKAFQMDTQCTHTFNIYYMSKSQYMIVLSHVIQTIMW